MTLTKNHVLIFFITIILFGVSLLVFYSNSVRAAVSNFTPTACYTAAATSSPAWSGVTPTSTVTCLLGADGATSARVNVEINASSSPLTIYNLFVEESMDNQDWFPTTPVWLASTTDKFNVTDRAQTTITFASSTIGGGAVPVANGVGISGANNRNHYSFDVPVTMRYVRVYAILNPASAAGAIWMQILPRENIN